MSWCPLQYFNNKSKHPLAPLWEPGDICFDGNSNVHLMDVKKWYGPRAFNIGICGSRTNEVIAKLPDLIRRIDAGSPVNGYVCQIGGNDMLMGATPQDYWDRMRELVDIVTDHLPREKCRWVSLPYVDRSLKTAYGLEMNKAMEIATFGMADWMSKNGHIFIDIFHPLKKNWDRCGKWGWHDIAHYADSGRKIVSDTIKGYLNDL